MTKILLKGNPVNTSGHLPEKGAEAPDVELVDADLNRRTISSFKGSNLLLNVFPSIDTGVCAASTRTFNEEASNLPDTKVLCVSRDLPFALARFCGAENLKKVIPLSDFDRRDFGKRYHLEFIDGPLKGLLSRCVIVVDKQGKIVYTEQVAEITEEPDYASAINALKA